MFWAIALAAAALLLGPVTANADPRGLRFVPYAGELHYGVNIAPPWPDGGVLEVNLPEHLERYPDTHGILRYSDPPSPAKWEVSPDGKRVVLDTESPTMPGVHVKGIGKVASPSRVEFSIEITNRTDKALPGIVPLYCFHYRTLTGFPQWLGNFDHTYVLFGGKLTRLAEIETENPEAEVKAGYIRGNPQRDSDHFPSQFGGLIAEPLDRGVIAVTSLDGKRAVLVSWTPAKSMLSNGTIPCIHIDPYYGPIAPGKSVARQGVVVFTEEPLERAVAKLAKEGWGAPVR